MTAEKEFIVLVFNAFSGVRVNYVQNVNYIIHLSRRITRLTVGRVKPLLDLHKLCALDAVMIPGLVWETIPSSTKFL